MAFCSCGQCTEEGTTLCPRCEALHILGLGMEAVDSEVRSTYRLLSKAWQPENFADDPRLKDSAEVKLKDIQSAFEFLTLTSTDRGGAQRPVYLSTRLAAAATVPEPVSELRVAFGHIAAPSVTQPSQAQATAFRPAVAPAEEPSQTLQTNGIFWQKYKIPLAVLAAIAALAILLLVWTASSSNPQADDSAATAHTPSAKVKHKNPLIGLLAFVLDAVDPQPASQISKSSPLASQTATFSAQGSTPEAVTPDEPSAPADAKNPSPGKSRAEAHGTHPGKAHGALPEGFKLKPYITVGSTRAEVIALEGNPTASSENKLVYGRSELILRYGAVVSWRIDRVTSPLRVKLWPRVFVDPYLDFFTVGSTKDEVIKVQGTPTAFTEDQFEYGGSIIYFSNNRVVRWKSDPASAILWAR